MSNFLKKALGVFVEFDEEERDLRQQTGEAIHAKMSVSKPVDGGKLNDEEIDKFEKHFHTLFENANLPGPDYFEFWKMMETLETHVPDESTRIAAVFATLAVQGLSKEKLVDSAGQYNKIIENDKQEFLKVVNTRLEDQIHGKKQTVIELEKKNAENAELIQKLTKEISVNQNEIHLLKQQINEEEQRIGENRNGYNIACDAMMAKIVSDIQKIKTHIH
jgi:hypothetical protein